MLSGSQIQTPGQGSATRIATDDHALFLVPTRAVADPTGVWMSVAICSRKAQTAIVWDTAANRWDLDLRAAPRRQSHPGAAVRRKPTERKVKSKVDRKACMCRADAALFESVLAFQSNRGTGPRATASGTVANPCNPAAPEAPLWQSCRLLVRRKPVGRRLLLDNSAAAARQPSGSHRKMATKQSSWQEPEL